jgi:hypothetical protein
VSSGNISEARSGSRITYGQVEFGAVYEVRMMLWHGSLRRLWKVGFRLGGSR